MHELSSSITSAAKKMASLSPVFGTAVALQDDFFFGPEWQAEHQRRLEKHRYDSENAQRYGQQQRISKREPVKRGPEPDPLVPLEPLDGSPWVPFGPAWRFQDEIRRGSRHQIAV